MGVTLNEQGFVLDGQSLPWLSGDIHYWRHAAGEWPLLLERVKSLGFKLICTYVPWSVHEAAAGSHDFGDLDPAKNIGRFIDLAGQMGFHVLVRPGPHINAELTYFGFPARLFDNPQVLARNARGGNIILPVLPRAFPAPSYASEAFWKEVEGWFDAVAPVLQPRLYPHGPIVGVQLDNELSYFFRTSAYDQDYHPDARAKWVAFLQDKYGGEFRAATIHGARELAGDRPLPDEFHAVQPADLPLYLDWMEFKERLLGDSLARLRRMWERRGVGDVVFFHNYPVCEAKTPFNIPLAEETAHCCGVDFYMHKTEFAPLKRKLLFLTGQSRFPAAPEFASGCYHLWPPVDLADQEFTAKVSWMFGLRGLNFYMLVERDRWYGSPITRTGGIRRDYWTFFEKHLALLQKLQPWRLRRVAPVCLLSPREYERLEGASTVIAPVPPLLFEGSFPAEDFCDEGNFGFARPIQWLYAKLLRGWEQALTQLGIPYVIGSSDLPPAALARYQAVVCPTFEFLGAQTQDAVTRYALGGGALICGPEAPSLDDAMHDYSELSKLTGRPIEKLDSQTDILVFEAQRGKIVLAADAPASPASVLPIAEVVCRCLGLAPIYPAAPPCETSLLRDHETGRGVLFIANPTAAPQRAKIKTPGERETLLDLENGDRIFGGENAVEVDLAPYTVRVLEIKS